tara:strand:+ start:42 stop:740 length:699 start_codon:yes stop_codon:yes gene_type:complete
MSSNNINSPKQYTTCLRREGTFDIQGLNRLNEDNCEKLFTTKQSESPGIYNLTQYRDCECGVPQVVETAVENPMIQFRDGYGVTECYMDESSELRIGKTKMNPKTPNQLFTRPYKTVPYMGRGSGDSFVESHLRSGEDTLIKKQCNTLAGINIPNIDPNHMPMIDHLKNNIQHPSHIIHDDALEGWVRGGAPSRQIVRDIEYLERCGSNYHKLAMEQSRKNQVEFNPNNNMN